MHGRAARSRPPDPLVAVGVTKRFGHVRALTDVELRVRGGQVVGLVGPNGSGKSTLLSIVAGLVGADSGEVTVAGERAGTLGAARAVAFVPDDPSGLDELTALELLTLLAVLHGAPASAAARRAALADAFELAPLLARQVGELSRGQRRKTALVGALQLDVPLLLVDEATATLDAAAVVALRDAIDAWAGRGGGVVLASHDRVFVDTVADVVVPLAGGAIQPHPSVIGQARRSCEPAAV